MGCHLFFIVRHNTFKYLYKAKFHPVILLLIRIKNRMPLGANYSANFSHLTNFPKWQIKS